eukprot:5038642-Pleurochrysis_carterae.AAC.1
MARQRPLPDLEAGTEHRRVVTLHSNRPPFRTNGRVRRVPSLAGGDTIVRVSPKRQFVEEDSQS